MTGLLGEVDLPAPIDERWFEDYVPGSVFEFGHSSLSETEVVGSAGLRRHETPGRVSLFAEPDRDGA